MNVSPNEHWQLHIENENNTNIYKINLTGKSIVQSKADNFWLMTSVLSLINLKLKINININLYKDLKKQT